MADPNELKAFQGIYEKLARERRTHGRQQEGSRRPQEGSGAAGVAAGEFVIRKIFIVKR